MKRTFLVPIASAAVLAASLASPALASFDPHFRVISKGIHGHEVGHGKFQFYERLIDPDNPKNKVGYDHGVCKPAGPVAGFCRATYHLDGEIGGHGDITVKGKVYQGHLTLKVVHGTDAFEGVTGGMTIADSDLCNQCAFQIFDLD